MRFVFSGYDLVVCGTVKEATEKIKAAPFDLIISDINLGGPSGIDFLEDWGKEGRRRRSRSSSGQPERPGYPPEGR